MRKSEIIPVTHRLSQSTKVDLDSFLSQLGWRTSISHKKKPATQVAGFFIAAPTTAEKLGLKRVKTNFCAL
jgi:hypothetical protein